MIVPFVHRWTVGLVGGGIRSHRAARSMREPRVACAGGSRQAAMTSTIRAGETAAAGIPQVARVMRIGLSFHSGSDKFSVILIHGGVSFQRGFAPVADT